MTKLAEYSPNWPIEDWSDYYRHTYVWGPECQFPVFVVGFSGGGIVTLKKPDGTVFNTNVSELTWVNLKHPKLGWLITPNTGLPVYVIKKPLREKSKGFRKQLLDFVLPGYISKVIAELNDPNWGNDPRKIRSLLVPHIRDNLSMFEYYEPVPNIGLETGADILRNTSSLAVILDSNRQNLLVKNHDPKDCTEFPFLFLHGPNIAGKVRKDMSIEQIGNVDIAEALYDNN